MSYLFLSLLLSFPSLSSACSPSHLMPLFFDRCHGWQKCMLAFLHVKFTSILISSLFLASLFFPLSPLLFPSSFTASSLTLLEMKLSPFVIRGSLLLNFLKKILFTQKKRFSETQSGFLPFLNPRRGSERS